MLVGYARVSTQEQDTAVQIAAMRAAGVAQIFEEKASGAKFDRPVLWQCLASLKTGDHFVFYKLDRVARSLSDLLKILDRVERSGASIRTAGPQPSWSAARLPTRSSWWSRSSTTSSAASWCGPASARARIRSHCRSWSPTS